MIDVTTAVEGDLGDALLEGALGNELADELRGLLVGADLALSLELGREGRSGAEGLAARIVDDGGIDVGVERVVLALTRLAMSGARSSEAAASLPFLTGFGEYLP